jgi:hypothetical protein
MAGWIREIAAAVGPPTPATLPNRLLAPALPITSRLPTLICPVAVPAPVVSTRSTPGATRSANAMWPPPEGSAMLTVAAPPTGAIILPAIVSGPLLVIATATPSVTGPDTVKLPKLTKLNCVLVANGPSVPTKFGCSSVAEAALPVSTPAETEPPATSLIAPPAVSDTVPGLWINPVLIVRSPAVAMPRSPETVPVIITLCVSLDANGPGAISVAAKKFVMVPTAFGPVRSTDGAAPDRSWP